MNWTLFSNEILFCLKTYVVCWNGRLLRPSLHQSLVLALAFDIHILPKCFHPPHLPISLCAHRIYLWKLHQFLQPNFDVCHEFSHNIGQIDAMFANISYRFLPMYCCCPTKTEYNLNYNRVPTGWRTKQLKFEMKCTYLENKLAKMFSKLLNVHILYTLLKILLHLVALLKA